MLASATASKIRESRRFYLDYVHDDQNLLSAFTLNGYFPASSMVPFFVLTLYFSPIFSEDGYCFFSVGRSLSPLFLSLSSLALAALYKRGRGSCTLSIKHTDKKKNSDKSLKAKVYRIYSHLRNKGENNLFASLFVKIFAFYIVFINTYRQHR